MKKIDEVAVVKEDECVEEAKNAFLSIALIVGILTIIVDYPNLCKHAKGYPTPDYLDDFDDFDDDFDDSFFDEEDPVEDAE